MRTLPERHRERDRIVALLDQAADLAAPEAGLHQLGDDLAETIAGDPPRNAVNGHAFECPCEHCSHYWTSLAGTAVFWDWMRRKPYR